MRAQHKHFFSSFNIHVILHFDSCWLAMFFCTQMTKLYGGKSRPLQGAGAEHFVLAEDFEGGGGHAGDGNRVAQCVEDFDGVPLCAIRGHVMVHQFYDVAAAETMLRHIALQRYICIEIELHSVLRLSYVISLVPATLCFFG
jgi:hypothetical protein